MGKSNGHTSNLLMVRTHATKWIFFFDVFFISGTLTWRNAVTLPYYRQLQAHMPGRQWVIS